jgi:hypothetical protein
MLQPKKFLLPLMTLASVFNFGCMGQVVRPNLDACWINDVSKSKECYNTLSDYDYNGIRLPNATKEIVSLPRGLRDLRGNLCINPTGQEELLRFLDETRKWIREHCR